MAIDSESKRRSAQMQAPGPLRPVADGTIAKADRATAAWLYSGIDYDGPAVIVGTSQPGLSMQLGRMGMT